LLGFDAISNGLSMADVTYKILLYWKRTRKDKKDGAIDMLAGALREMGRTEAARVVFQCHKDSKEVTPEAFAQILSQMSTYLDRLRRLLPVIAFDSLSTEMTKDRNVQL
jgi:hypothetical protein